MQIISTPGVDHPPAHYKFNSGPGRPYVSAVQLNSRYYLSEVRERTEKGRSVPYNINENYIWVWISVTVETLHRNTNLNSFGRMV